MVTGDLYCLWNRVYTEYAGPEISVHLCIASSFFTADSESKFWSHFNTEVYGSKMEFSL